MKSKTPHVVVATTVVIDSFITLMRITINFHNHL